MSRIKKIVLVAPKSTGGNFEYVAIPRQGLLYLSRALEQWKGTYLYDREIWYEDRSGNIDPAKDLQGLDLLMVTALINEAPRAYQISRTARALYPELKIIGGGPHMSPLFEEALRFGQFDVIVQREGEDIIGPLSDVLLTYKGSDLYRELRKIPGIAYLEDGHVVQTSRVGLVAPNFVELPDFEHIRDLTTANPLAAGLMETVRGCVEKCTYCQVIQQFLGYRMVPREVEHKRLAQLRKLAEDGLIYTSRDGRFSVFVSDDLHPPPLRAVKYRNERFERLKGWKGHTEGVWMICQTRAEIGQDPELASAMWEAGYRMLYAGVESSSVENLKAVRKRQDPSQVHKDLVRLNELGFAIAAMTIIGLPYDTEEGIMEMADWVRTVSRYQTANWLTPLPATSNWEALAPLDADGSLLPEGKMRPYHLYTGRQLVHQDRRWSMQESRELYGRYTGKLHPVDSLYERTFRMFQRNWQSRTAIIRETERAISSAIEEIKVALDSLPNRRTYMEQRVSLAVDDIKGALEVLPRRVGDFEQRVSTALVEIRGAFDSLPQRKLDAEQRVSLAIDEIRGALETLAKIRTTSSASSTS